MFRAVVQMGIEFRCQENQVSEHSNRRVSRPRKTTITPRPRAALHERSIRDRNVPSNSGRIDSGINLSNRYDFKACRHFGLPGVYVSDVAFPYRRGDSGILAASVQNVGREATLLEVELVCLVYALCHGHIRHPYNQRHTIPCGRVLGRHIWRRLTISRWPIPAIQAD